MNEYSKAFFFVYLSRIGEFVFWLIRFPDED
jgi:hypothetical protein